MLYLLSGAIFVIVANLSFRRGGFRTLVLTSILAVTLLLVVLLRDVSPGEEGTLILLGTVPPTGTAVITYWAVKERPPLALIGQWTIGMLVWLAGCVLVGFASVFLGWVDL
jgi:hypothetical protein